MRTANIQMRQAMKSILRMAALASCVLFPAAAHADTPGLYASYYAYAFANEWVKIEDGKEVWKDGYESTDDVDLDGMLNQEEFNGWQTTLNGRTGW